MKAINKMKRLVLFVILFLGFAGMSGVVWAQSMDEYNYLPPFLGVDVKPNILLLLDNSGSMNGCAYPNSKKTGPSDCTFIKSGVPSQPLDYEKTRVYSGYFEADKCYAYSQKKFNSPQAKTGTPPSCKSSGPNPWDGSFLNWLTMRRMDVAKWVLTGGLCNSVRSNENSCSTLRGQFQNTWDLKKQANFTGVGPASFNGIRCVLIYGGDFFISSDATGNCAKIITQCIGGQKGSVTKCKNTGPQDRLFEIRVDAGVKQTGVIQKIGDRARFGLMLFNTDQGGKIEVNVGGNLVTLVQKVEAVPATTWTPLGEALYTATRYFAQIMPRPYFSTDYTVSPNSDPYCFDKDLPSGVTTGCKSSPAKGEWVPCCKSFVLVFTDGQPTQDTDIPATIRDVAHTANPHIKKHHDYCSDYYEGTGSCPDGNNGSNTTHYLDDVAYWAHTTDLRPDGGGNIAGLINQPSTSNKGGNLPGMQNLNIYTFLAFEKDRPDNILKDTSKVGAFNDSDAVGTPGFNIPDKQSEWDIKINQDELFTDVNGNGKYDDGEPFTDSNTNGKYNFGGDLVPDGVPDTYYSAEDADSMRTNLLTALNDILQKSASGTALSFLASASSGEGAIYQSYFFPASSETSGTVAWVGHLQALFLDNEGQFREDTNKDGRLILTEDSIVQTSFNKSRKETEVTVCAPGADGKKTTNCSKRSGLDKITPLWEAGNLLAKRNAADRNILTWVDGGSNPNGFNNIVEPSEVIPFADVNKSTLKPYLRATSETESKNIINFVRGENIPGSRNRQRLIDGTDLTWKLGDILYSDPISVGAPAEAADRKYGDRTFTGFATRHRTRRHVIYAGANDGMLHAFNGGFFHPGDDKQRPDDPNTPKDESKIQEHGFFTVKSNDNPSAKAMPLGEEIWAFVPQELLPHLKWIVGPDYDKNKHVSFVDGSPRIAEVRIFTEESACSSVSSPKPRACIHPDGWGTILIGSMRMGGGLLKVDLNGANGTADPGEDRFRSAYFAFDITDPEAAPKLLWVFKDDDLGFTTSFPTIVRMKNPTGNQKGLWYAVFGSGPLTYRGERDSLIAAGNRFGSTASEFGQIYVLNLESGQLIEKRQVDRDSPIKDKHAFMGDPAAFDLERDPNPPPAKDDHIFDVIYIGETFGKKTNANNVNTWDWSGKMYRILTYRNSDPTAWKYSVLHDAKKPILMQPTVSQDTMDRPLVMFGTGRFFSSGPESDQQDMSRQALYAIQEGGPGGCWDTGAVKWKASCTSVLLTDLEDVTTAPDIRYGGCFGPCSDKKSIFDLARTMRPGGWVLNLQTGGERALSKITLVAGLALVSTYTPTVGVGVAGPCETLGRSSLYATYYKTGSAFATTNNPKGPLGLTAAGTRVRRSTHDDVQLVGGGIAPDALGDGIASRPSFVANESTVTIYVNSSTGSMVSGILNVKPRLKGVKLFLETTE